MARPEIEMIETFAFEIQIAISIKDINYANHFGNDSFVSMTHEARVQFMNSLGFSEFDIGGKSFIVSDLAVSYKSQAFYGDPLRFEVVAGDFNQHSCDIFYKVTHSKTQKLILQAKTVIILFDYQLNKVTRIPEEFYPVFSN